MVDRVENINRISGIVSDTLIHVKKWCDTTILKKINVVFQTIKGADLFKIGGKHSHYVHAAGMRAVKLSAPPHRKDLRPKWDPAIFQPICDDDIEFSWQMLDVAVKKLIGWYNWFQKVPSANSYKQFRQAEKLAEIVANIDAAGFGTEADCEKLSALEGQIENKPDKNKEKKPRKSNPEAIKSLKQHLEDNKNSAYKPPTPRIKPILLKIIRHYCRAIRCVKVIQEYYIWFEAHLKSDEYKYLVAEENLRIHNYWLEWVSKLMDDYLSLRGGRSAGGEEKIIAELGFPPSFMDYYKNNSQLSAA